MTRTATSLAPHVVAFYFACCDGGGLAANEWSSCAEPQQYRAIKWRRSSDDITVVAPFRATRNEALADVFGDYAPHARAVYEIELSCGERLELSDEEHELAVESYHEAIASRDALGVWG